MSTVRTARLEMRIPKNIKELAEKSSALAGNSSITEFVIQAIREKSNRVMNEQNSISLSAKTFDSFMDACEKASTPSSKMKATAKRFDDEGYQ